MPKKTCITCGRFFIWRSKWANCWTNIKYCSERCRRRRNTKETHRVFYT
ncbi:MAG: DUF2256 domain-containing protein [Kiloniellales bacterium]|nr:DUF2256 domain-containing protein [Kiloniellales bacterium]